MEMKRKLLEMQILAVFASLAIASSATTAPATNPAAATDTPSENSAINAIFRNYTVIGKRRMDVVGRLGFAPAKSLIECTLQTQNLKLNAAYWDLRSTNCLYIETEKRDKISMLFPKDITNSGTLQYISVDYTTDGYDSDNKPGSEVENSQETHTAFIKECDIVVKEQKNQGSHYWCKKYIPDPNTILILRKIKWSS